MSLQIPINNLPLKSKIYSITRHPSIIKDIVQGKGSSEIRSKVRLLDEKLGESQGKKEALNFISYLKKNSPYNIINPNDESKLNRLCYIEDWENNEIKEALKELQKLSSGSFIHRKDWEWALA